LFDKTMTHRIADRQYAAMAIGDGVLPAGLTAEFDERWDSGRRIGRPIELIRAAYLDMAE
jgi:hypothetical protein